MRFQLFGADAASIVAPYLKKTDTLAYECQLSYLILWRDVEDIHYAIEDDSLFIQQRASHSFLLPFSDDIPHALDLLIDHVKETGEELRLVSVPKEYSHYLDERFTVEDDRDLYDYIYSRDKLSKLSGKHLQAKRNHISQFMRAYPGCELVPITPDMRAECINMDALWCEKHELHSREMTEERMAIERAFRFFDTLGLRGLALRIDGHLAAFTIGEVVNGGKEAIVHFEKADISYPGIYAYINREFVLSLPETIQWIDRQEDMGLEGLRKSKLSYHPDLFQEKVKAKLN